VIGLMLPVVIRNAQTSGASTPLRRRPSTAGSLVTGGIGEFGIEGSRRNEVTRRRAAQIRTASDRSERGQVWFLRSTVRDYADYADCVARSANLPELQTHGNHTPAALISGRARHPSMALFRLRRRVACEARRGRVGGLRLRGVLCGRQVHRSGRRQVEDAHRRRRNSPECARSEPAPPREEQAPVSCRF
jgi:hypothetical protein